MMKIFTKIIPAIFSLLLIISGSAYAQPALFGTTYSGGDNYNGSIYTTDINGDNYQSIFEGDVSASYPVGKLVEVSNGIFYGMTYYSAAFNGEGAIYEYNANTDIYTIKHVFTYDEGAYPEGSLMKASNGKLYGVTADGGINGDGVIFEYDYTSETYTVLLELENSTTGSYPTSSFVQASNGKLYVAVASGGTGNNGTIIELDIATNTITKRADFSNGTGPEYAMVERNGKLYGFTTFGGANNGGTLFEFDISSFALNNLYVFPSNSRPNCTPIIASNGKLYGFTELSGTNNNGELFEYDFNTSSLTNKIQFDDYTLREARGTLVEVTTGKLLGICLTGGANDSGAVFEYDITNSTFEVRHDFAIEIGDIRESFVLANDGALYGLAQYAGTSSSGSIYTYNTTTFEVNELYSFNALEGGYNPMTLLQATSGKIYGVNNFGGIYGAGTLFEMDPLTYEITPLVQFKAKVVTSGRPTNTRASNRVEAIDYSSPHALIEASNGKLYGRTNRGGHDNRGVIFEYDPVTKTITEKVSFSEATGNNGSGTRGGLLEVLGKIYGLTRRAGPSGGGTIFEYDISTESFTNIVDLGAIGIYEAASELVLAPNGKLYGTTTAGGGILFEYDIADEALAIKIQFNLVSGANPYGGLVVASDDKLLGMTYSGGNFNTGEIYEYIPSTNTYNGLASFDINTGRYPTDNILAASNGKFFGLTSSTVFEFDINTNTITNKQILANGAASRFQPSTLIETCTQPLFDEPVSTQLCLGDALSVDLNSVNTNTYVWKLNGNVLADITSGSLNITELASDDAGEYTVEMTNTCGTSIATFSIGVSNIVTDFIISDITCFGATDGSIQVSANGGVSPYQFSIDGVNFQTSNKFSSLTAGNYDITTKDAIGCISTNNIVIVTPDAIIATITANNVSCNGNQDGSINILVTGGTSPYEYRLDDAINYQTSPDFTALQVATYQVFVRDAKNCTSSLEVIISEPNALTAAMTTSDASCSDASDGSITVTAAGGTSPYEYSIDGANFSSSNQFDNLAAGSYTINVTDNKGCSYAETFTIDAPDELTVAASFDGTEVNLTASGGTAPYEYSESGNAFQTSSTFVLSNGNYSFEVRDANGCIATSSDNVVVTAVEPKSTIMFSLYPNPSNTNITIESPEVLKTVRIIDFNGKVIKSVNPDNRIAAIDISTLIDGIYLIEVVEQAGNANYQKFMKE